MFIKTIAVGPLEPTELCVTGGATVALPLLHREAHGTKNELAGEFDVARLTTCAMGVRMAIAKRC
jgi:hypothetical protein